MFHCDIKGANILIGIDGQVKITDFGLARQIGIKHSRESSSGTFGASVYSGNIAIVIVGSQFYLSSLLCNGWLLSWLKEKKGGMKKRMFGL